ncbi:Predicted histone tail methylase containing SET domain [Phaffia rhodozyma]|uniref:Predicted histone tail methylase containing SET domain n=1 Tax=Phaffia rhodozyma TaxID=264483 RepID=A0A0F7SMG5_PHARH|nr:Predicted histone tail methylase containing SET domain [Phaffia rhodozyma]
MSSQSPSLYVLKHTPSSGASLFSSSSQVIPPGTLLFEDRALFTLPLASKSEDDVLKAVRSLSKEKLCFFLELSNCRAGGNKFVGIFKTNVLPAGPQENSSRDQAQKLQGLQCPLKVLPYAEARPHRSSNAVALQSIDLIHPFLVDKLNRSGIFPLASRLNHSCSPNAEATFSASSGTLQVYATHPIEPQQEITISYLSTKLLLPTLYRKQHLLSSFSFECDCPVCPSIFLTEQEEEMGAETISSALSESDIRRSRIQALKLQIDKSFPTSPRETYLDAIRLVQTCRAEGLKLEEAFALATLAQVLIMWGGAGTEKCESVVKQVTDAFGIVRGKGGEDATRWARWLGRTGEHPRAGVLGKWDFEKEVFLNEGLI